MAKRKRQNLLVGITGGMGAGKSALADFFKSSGYTVLSADTFAKKITKPGSDALKKISDIFGPKSILENGEMDRKFVREIISKNTKYKSMLEEIIHPRIQELTKIESEKLFSAGEKIVFYEAPLLFEAKSEKNLDYVICVVADDEIRLERIVTRDKTSRESAKSLMESQMSQAEKIKKSNFVIENNTSKTDLKNAAKKVLEEIQKLIPAA